MVIGASALVHAYSSRKIFCRCFFLLTGAAGDGYLGIGQAARGLPSHQKEPPFQTRPDIVSQDRTPGVAPAMGNSEATAWLQEPPPLPCPSGWCCRLQWDRSSPITTAALGPPRYSRMGFCWSILSQRALLGPGLLRCTGNPLHIEGPAVFSGSALDVEIHQHHIPKGQWQRPSSAALVRLAGK